MNTHCEQGHDVEIEYAGLDMWDGTCIVCGQPVSIILAEFEEA
jgi:hypothetical protein